MDPWRFYRRTHLSWFFIDKTGNPVRETTLEHRGRSLFIGRIFFGLGHAYQGIVGMISTGLSSLVFWAAYFLSKRELGVSLFAHGLWDTIGWLLIFSGS